MSKYNLLFNDEMRNRRYGFARRGAAGTEHCQHTVLKPTLVIAQWRWADSGNSANDVGYCLRCWKR